MYYIVSHQWLVPQASSTWRIPAWPATEEGIFMARILIRSLAILTVVALAVTFMAPPVRAERDLPIDEASGEAMMFDAALMRPMGVVATVGGAVVFVLSLPFSALGGNVGEAADQLVVAPAKFTFVRPLGHMD
jgi:hypothetical protein